MELEKNKVVKGHQSSKASLYGSRGEKCLAKFTSSNGTVYGSLTLELKDDERFGLEDQDATIKAKAARAWCKAQTVFIN